jgi:hypothetical protein
MTAIGSSVAERHPLLAGFPGFAGLTVVLVAAAGLLLTLAFKRPGDTGAIAISAGVACLVQIGAFPAVRALAARHMMLGWGAGTLLRFFTLAIYAVLAGTVLALPLDAALISLFVFYFLSMVIEPLFLRS